MCAQQRPEATLAGVRVGGDEPVVVMGALNVSPESFYGGSIHRDRDALVRAGAAMARAGAAILDVGARSTAPYLDTAIDERAEADHLAADGIVGVNLRMQMYAWGQSCLEFVATGTAVRHLAGQGAHRAPDGRAFTSDLSAQDFFRLLAAGAVPVAFVLGTCVYHIAHQGVMQSLRQMGQNQEMLQFTQGVYEARELALARMQAEAAQAKASGIVGVTVEVKNHVWGEHATEFLATGTAVRRLADEHRLPETTPKPTFTLGLDA